MRAPSLLFLEPPYAAVRRFSGAQPALGTVALLDVARGRAATSEIRAHMAQAPWCPLCLLAEPDSGIRSTRRLARTCVVFGLDDLDGASTILQAVARRPLPAARDLADWIVARTRLPLLARPLADLFDGPALREGTVSLAHRAHAAFRQLGTWGPRDWQRLANLARLAADRALLHRAFRPQDPARSLVRDDVAELLGVDADTFRDRYGWEWVLEHGLRRAGFFEGSAGHGARVLRPREEPYLDAPALCRADAPERATA